MRTILTTVFVMFACSALAQGEAICQGGDGVWDATVVEVLPFFAEGTTSGYADDYDAPCVYGDEQGPDVVYIYTPAASGEINIDTCGSNFDTVVHVFDANANQDACNDNRPGDGACWMTSSRINRLEVQAGVSYFIVVDGATSEESGNYDLMITEYRPYEFAPPWYAHAEAEPPLVDGYVDTFNGGCDADEVAFQGHPFDPAFGYNASVHGRTGWYGDGAAGTLFDTDWFMVEIYAQGTLNLTIEATETCRVYWYEVGSTCGSLNLGGSMTVGAGWMNEMQISGPYATAILVKVRPVNSSPPDGVHHEFEYLLGVRSGVGWERPYHTPLGDEGLDAPVLAHERNRINFPVNEFGDDHAPHEACADSAGVANDGLAQVYLWEGQRIGVGWVDIWYPEPSPPAGRSTDVCFYLVDDARLTPGSCIDVRCGVYSEWGFGHMFTAPRSGWYYLIWDFDTEDAANYGTVSAHVEFPLSSPYQLPPPPPPGDRCESALSIPRGPFAFIGDLAAATNGADPGRDGCLDDPAVHWTGGDVIHRVDLQAGDRLVADLTTVGDWDAALYLLSDCEQPLGACVASGLHLEHVALEDQTLWLVCDSWGNGPRAYALTGSLDSITASPAAAGGYGIGSVQPNPCNPTTTVTYSVAHDGLVNLTLHDLRGRRVRTLVSGHRASGHHLERWDGTDGRGRQVASGIYVVRLESGGQVHTRSLAVLR
jgi:hypothetical protein